MTIKTHYYFDRKITIALIVSIVGVVIGLAAKVWSSGYIASQQVSRIDTLEKRSDNLEASQRENNRIFAERGQWGEQYSNRLSVDETNISNLKESLNDIKKDVSEANQGIQKILMRAPK